MAGCCKHCRLQSIHLEIKLLQFLYMSHNHCMHYNNNQIILSLSLANIEVAAKPKDGRNEANLFGNHV
jgi:hypothetical protein